MRDDSLPLDGLVILDLTRVLAGPYCTHLLADLGARVIKVERPGEGDEMRRGPHQLEPGRDDQSTYFTRVNAGKQSVGLDVGTAAQTILLAAHSLGLASGIVTSFSQAAVRAILNLPERLSPELFACLGYAGPAQPLAMRARTPVTWQALTDWERFPRSAS